ncbi:MAG: AAA family ATPase [Phenylobacterium sp.]|nr:AAA family ATPase [Phenylobacterium sp.]
MIKPNFFLISGGPGVGKTALLEELRRRGERVVEETHRRLIREGRAESGSSRLGTLAALEDIARFEAMGEVQERVFFDRGVVDSLTPEAPAWMWAAAKRLRYNHLVFTPPPWREIYTQDDERRQTFEDCLATHEMIRRQLQGLGYRPVTVAPGPVEARAAFVLEVTAGLGFGA